MIQTPTLKKRRFYFKAILCTILMHLLCNSQFFSIIGSLLNMFVRNFRKGFSMQLFRNRFGLLPICFIFLLSPILIATRAFGADAYYGEVGFDTDGPGKGRTAYSFKLKAKTTCEALVEMKQLHGKRLSEIESSYFDSENSKKLQAEKKVIYCTESNGKENNCTKNEIRDNPSIDTQYFYVGTGRRSTGGGALLTKTTCGFTKEKPTGDRKECACEEAISSAPQKNINLAQPKISNGVG